MLAHGLLYNWWVKRTRPPETNDLPRIRWTMKKLSIWTIPALMFALSACGGPETGEPIEDASTADSGQFVKGGLDGKADASVVASFVDFKFSGRLIASSNETCVIELNSPAPIHVMVNGWARSSEFDLVGRRN